VLHLPELRECGDRIEKWRDRKVHIMCKYCVYCGQALDWSDEEKQMVGFRAEARSGT
jgi:hypothetical protein